MANFTEQAISEAFVKLLNERPLDKITVSDIAHECGINRNTFYYHYHDVYELVDVLFKREEENVIKNVRDDETLAEGLGHAIGFVLENKQAIAHIYTAVNTDSLNEYLYNSAYACMHPYVLGQAREAEEEQGVVISESVVDRITFLYASMLQGALINIFRTDSIESAADIVADASNALEGVAKTALVNLAGAKKSDN